jgi:DNA-binding HxlR family transcriptional regulator
MEEGKEIENDRQRAEVFDALGHPTRITILKALQEGAAGFAELKKKTTIESSGHLQHHLNKLDGLIKTDQYGKYCLSDQGKDALVTVQTVENASATKETLIKTPPPKGKRGLKSVAILLTVLLIASTAIAFYEYNQAVMFQEKFNTLNLEATAYYDEFGLIPFTNVNSSFAPPISMYRALQIALQTDGWNKTSLNGMVVGAYLMHGYLNTTSSIPDICLDGPVTTPPNSYNVIYDTNAVYRYIWEITVNNASRPTRPPIGFSLIDASTGQVLPNPPLW